MNPLEIWHSRADASAIAAMLGADLGVTPQQSPATAVHRVPFGDRPGAQAVLTETTSAGLRIKADPPALTPLDLLLPDTERVDLERLPHALLRDYVPEEMLPGIPPANEGHRVIQGQRLLQASGDVFLGWQTVQWIDGRRRDFSVRPLKDLRWSARVETMSPVVLGAYGAACGGVLARAHARSGDAIAIAAYVGSDDAVPDAITEFAESYADVNESDHARFAAAVTEGRLSSPPRS